MRHELEVSDAEIGPKNRVSLATLLVVLAASLSAAGWAWRIEAKTDKIIEGMADRWTGTDMHIWSVTLRERNTGIKVPTVEDVRKRNP